MSLEFLKDAYYYQYHTYQPYIASFRNNDEIRIPVQSQDLYTVPGESYIYIEGRMTYKPTIPVPKADGTGTEPPRADDGTNVDLDNTRSPSCSIKCGTNSMGPSSIACDIRESRARPRLS